MQRDVEVLGQFRNGGNVVCDGWASAFFNPICIVKS